MNLRNVAKGILLSSCCSKSKYKYLFKERGFYTPKGQYLTFYFTLINGQMIDRVLIRPRIYVHCLWSAVKPLRLKYIVACYFKSTCT